MPVVQLIWIAMCFLKIANKVTVKEDDDVAEKFIRVSQVLQFKNILIIKVY